jgi:threonine dehydrogenase-like Zn-dependent dehydrogenase
MFSLTLLRPSEKGGIPGHEFSGIVEKVGKNVKGVKEGDRVVALSNGGMAEYVSVPYIPGFNILQIPTEVSFEEAATLEPLSNSYHAMMKGNPSKGDNIVIIGAGCIGLGIILCLRALELDINKIIVVDLSDHRLKVAKELGADEVVNASKGHPLTKINQLVEMKPLEMMPTMKIPKVDIVYDCVGYMKQHEGPVVLQHAINLAFPKTGRIVVHGIFESDVKLNLLPMVGKQITIIGSFGFERLEAEKCLELMATKKVDMSKLISHEFPLDKIKEAFETQCNTGESVKVLIKP